MTGEIIFRMLPWPGVDRFAPSGIYGHRIGNELQLVLVGHQLPLEMIRLEAEVQLRCKLKTKHVGLLHAADPEHATVVGQRGFVSFMFVIEPEADEKK